MKRLRTEKLASGFHFLEGPRWRNDWLWVSDMVGRRVYRVSMSGQVEFVVDVPGRPSGLGFLPDGTPLVVSMRDRCLYKIQNGTLILHADLSALVAQELNDMVLDRQGRAYVGSFGFETTASSRVQEGRLILVEPTGTGKILLSNLMFPNGCSINFDTDELVLAESFGRRLVVYQILDDGTLRDPHVYAELDKIAPDGICLDRAGAVWLAASNRSQFIRVRKGGHVTHRVLTPGRLAVACELGGCDGRTLFCLTADKDYEDVPSWGPTAQIELVHVDTPRST